MKYSFTLSLVFFANLINAQFSCDNIELIGIYFNNYNTSQVSLLLTNKSEINDGNQNVYTSFQIITDQGDTILTSPSCQCYALPNSVEDTTVYNLELSDKYGTIYDLPDEFCGKLITQFPNCEIEFCKNKITYPNLPSLQEVECNEYKIIGIYETAHGGVSNYSFLLTYTNPNFIGIGPTGYTSFEFFNKNQVSLAINTGPHFIMPQYVEDTIIIHTEFREQITSNECLVLKTTAPDCIINYCGSSTSTKESQTRSEVAIFPNPTTGEITISEHIKFESINIYNSSGQLVLKEKRNNFSIKHLAKGVYNVEIISENNEKVTTRLCKI